jgi:hypothetical protein
LISLLYNTGPRSGTDFALTVPTSATNGCGLNTATSNTYFPVFRVQQIGGVVQGATLTLTSGSGTYNTFNFGSMNTSISNVVRINF